MMQNLTPFDKIRKKRARKRLVKRLFILTVFFSCVLLFGLFYNSGYYYVITGKVYDVVQNLKVGQGYPVQINSFNIKCFNKSGNSLIALYDDVISVFNKSAYKTLYDQHMLVEPQVITNNNKIFIYERLGNKCKAYSKTRKIFERQLDYPIYTSTISNDGKVAIVTSSDRYLCKLEVWNDSYKKIFQWNSADKYITSVDFSPNNKDLIVSCLEVENGCFKSTLIVLNINKDKEVSRIEFKDEMVLSVKYKSYNSICVVGEKQACIINNKCNIKSKYDFKGKHLKAFNNQLLKATLLVFENYDKSSNLIITIDSSCRECGNKIIDGFVKSIDVDRNIIYILTDNEINAFNIFGKTILKCDVNSKLIGIVVNKGKIHTITSSEIDIID